MKTKPGSDFVNFLASEVEKGSISRRLFFQTATRLGMTSVAALALLGLPKSVRGDSADALLKSAQAELENASRELKAANQQLDEAVEEYNRKMEEMGNEILNDQGEENVFIKMNYPAGASPKVFQSGWIFGAQALFNQGEDEEPLDVSQDVEWGGTGKFNPGKGISSRPVFSSPGANKIVLAVHYKGRKITRTYTVDVVSTAKYSSVGTKAKCMADAHGCPACPHTVVGPIKTGSPNVFINGKPAARMGDTGIHAACCGRNTFTIVDGDRDVLINGKPAAYKNCTTKHCGGMGKIIE